MVTIYVMGLCLFRFIKMGCLFGPIHVMSIRVTTGISLFKFINVIYIQICKCNIHLGLKNLYPFGGRFHDTHLAIYVSLSLQ